ncbi:MAG: protein translocase subunit SecDF, partial [Bacteroidales bacterium]|nr:protein translocase subunit SecDF [Bacteroidales bacterium]
MQSKGAIKFFAIALALVCLFQLSFTFVTTRVERKARAYAHNEHAHQVAADKAAGDEVLKSYLFDSISKSRERYYLDSMSSEVVYNIGFRKYTFQETKEREINLGLDLKGGMNVTLEVSVVDIVRALSGYSKNTAFVQAVDMALQKQKKSQTDFITLFAESFQELDPNASLASIFINSPEFKDRLTFNSSNADVIGLVRAEANDAIDRSFNILRTRIDRFGVAQPNIQKLQASGRILVELPGIKEPERVRKLLQGSARLEFWETYQFSEIAQYFTEANKRIKAIEGRESIITDEAATSKGGADTVVEKTPAAPGSDTTTTALEDLLASDTTKSQPDEDKSRAEWAEENPLFQVLQPAFYQGKDGQVYPSEGATVGYAAIKDTALVNTM